MTDTPQGSPEGDFPDDLVELVSASLDGELTAAEEERLADLLVQDPALHAYRERMRRMKRLFAGSGPLLAGGTDSGQALEALQTRLATLPASEGPSLSWQLKLGVAACVAGLVLVTWQIVAFSRRVNDRSDGPTTPSIASEDTPPVQPDVDPIQPDVPPEETPDETPPVEEPTPPEAPDEPDELDPLPPTEDPDTTPPDTAPDEDDPDEPVIAKGPDVTPIPPLERDPDEGTRVKPKDPEPEPRPALDLAALKRLVAGIHSAQTPLEQRPSLIRSLGDARFDHPLAYQTLSAILDGSLDRALPIGQVNGVQIGPVEWRSAARLACAKLDSALAVRVLLGTLREASDGPSVELALASMRRDESVGTLAESLGGRVSQVQAETAVRALAAIGNPQAYAAVLSVFDNARPAGLVRQAALAVGSLGDQSSLDPLREALDDKRVVVRTGAAGGLGRLGARLPTCTDASVEALAGALQDSELAVCSAAAQALAAVGGPGVPTLIGCLDPQQEPRAAVRDVAREQLWLLSGNPLTDAALAADWWRKVAEAGTPLGAPAAVLTVDSETSPFAYAAWGERTVFMLDTSGSMRGPKWELTKAEVTRAIEAYGKRRTSKDRGWANLLAFADAPRLVNNRYFSVASASARIEASKLLSRIKPVEVAQTDLLKAFQALQRVPKVDTLVLVSDGGQDPQDLARTLSYVRQTLEQRPMRIHTLWLTHGQGPLVVDRGAGHPDDPASATFMRRLAQETGGLFVRER